MILIFSQYWSNKERLYCAAFVLRYRGAQNFVFLEKFRNNFLKSIYRQITFQTLKKKTLPESDAHKIERMVYFSWKISVNFPWKWASKGKYFFENEKLGDSYTANSSIVEFPKKNIFPKKSNASSDDLLLIYICFDHCQDHLGSTWWRERLNNNLRWTHQWQWQWHDTEGPFKQSFDAFLWFYFQPFLCHGNINLNTNRYSYYQN